MARSTRVFYANSKQATREATDDAVASLRVFLAVKLPATAFEVTSGVEDFQRHFKASGSWHGWEESVASRYALVVVPTGGMAGGASSAEAVVGRATFEIVLQAKTNGRAIVLWDGQAFLRAKTATKAGDDTRSLVVWGVIAA